MRVVKVVLACAKDVSGRQSLLLRVHNAACFNLDITVQPTLYASRRVTGKPYSSCRWLCIRASCRASLQLTE